MNLGLSVGFWGITCFGVFLLIGNLFSFSKSDQIHPKRDYINDIGAMFLGRRNEGRLGAKCRGMAVGNEIISQAETLSANLEKHDLLGAPQSEEGGLYGSGGLYVAEGLVEVNPRREVIVVKGIQEAQIAIMPSIDVSAVPAPVRS